MVTLAKQKKKLRLSLIAMTHSCSAFLTDTKVVGAELNLSAEARH